MANVLKKVLVLIGVLGFSADLWAWSESEIRASVESALSVRHPSETGDWWRSLGPKAAQVILAMFKAEKNTYRQIRLVDALAWFDDPQAVEFLKEQAAHNSNSVLRRAAIHSVSVSQGVKEKAFLKTWLEDSDPHMRLAAASALQNLKDPAADQLVRSFLKTEKIVWVSSAVRRSGRSTGSKLIIEGKRKY